MHFEEFTARQHLKECKEKRSEWIGWRLLYLGLGVLFIFVPFPFMPYLAARAVLVVLAWIPCVMIDVDAHQRISRLEKAARDVIASVHELEKELEQQQKQKLQLEQQLQELEEQQHNNLEAQAAAWVDQCTKAGGLIAFPSSFPCHPGEGVLFVANDVQMQDPFNKTDEFGNTTIVWQTVGEGDLVLTNQRLVFAGPIINRQFILSEILKTNKFVQGVDISSVEWTATTRFLFVGSYLLATLIDLVKNYPNLPLVPAASGQFY